MARFSPLASRAIVTRNFYPFCARSTKPFPLTWTSIALSTTTPPITIRRSKHGWHCGHDGICISSQPTAPGSIRSNGSLHSLRTKQYVAAHLPASNSLYNASTTSLLPTTHIASHSNGPPQLTRYLRSYIDFAHVSLGQDTSSSLSRITLQQTK